MYVVTQEPVIECKSLVMYKELMNSSIPTNILFVSITVHSVLIFHREVQNFLLCIRMYLFK